MPGSKSNTRLTKYESGTDNEYYVVYLPPNIEGTDGAQNYNLTSGGLFDISAYGSAPANYTLKENKFYTIKVHFRNTSGDGGLSEDTVQTKNNP